MKISMSTQDALKELKRIELNGKRKTTTTKLITFTYDCGSGELFSFSLLSGVAQFILVASV